MRFFKKKQSCTLTITFVFKDNFDDVGSEFEPWIPADHKNSTDLKIMKKIKDPEYQQWATYIHDLWLQLGKKIKTEVIVRLIYK